MVKNLIDSLRLRGGMKTFHEALYFCSRDLFGYTRDEFAARWRPKCDKDTGTLRTYTQPLAEGLFEQWKLHRDPEWLYTHPEYKWDSVGVSTFQTSTTTTSGVSLLNKASANPKLIFDWGAGPGFSSMIMAANFPNAEVHYNEINGELIKVFEWFRDHAHIKNIKHVKAPEETYDLIQAYEIAEHIPHATRPNVGDPILETLKVLKHTQQNAHFLHSSCWSAENRYFTLGHFLHYYIGGQLVNNTRAGMHFRKMMSQFNWNVVGTGWNSRPFLFNKELK